MRDKFTEWLIHSRHVAGLTQEEAAERIGIARTLAGYEAGSTPDDVVVACDSAPAMLLDILKQAGDCIL